MIPTAEKYVKQHPQEVTLAWVDNTTRAYTADQAVQLCRDPRIAACIIGAECEDQQLTDMLNRMLDDAGDD